MDSDRLIEAIDLLITRVEMFPVISAAGLKNKMYPDDNIAALHNRLGNIKHYVSDMSAAFNATDQFLSIRAAERELDEVGNSLLSLHQTSLLTDSQYQLLSQTLHELDELLRKSTDPEYT